MVTMQDVANCAGVSKATVSRVLNGKDLVRADLKARVEKAIEETGYRPNLLAQQMAMQKTSFIGFAMSSELYDGPYFASMMFGAATFINQHNHQLIFADSKYNALQEREAIDFLLRMRCAGVVVYPEYMSDDALDEMVGHSPVPLYVLNRQLARHPQNGVWVDHARAAVEMMEYLIAQGHRDIAFIGGKAGSRSGAGRLGAWRDGMQRLDVAPVDALLCHGDWSMESGYHAARELLARQVTFSAIMAANDDMAIGAIKALTEAGIRVPEHISVAGFDNSRIGNYVSPALTTMEIPVVQMVQAAIGRILGEDSGESRPLNTQLIVRESVAPRR